MVGVLRRAPLCGALVAAGALLAACSHPSQVSFASTERPSAYGSPQGVPSPAAAHYEAASVELPSDDEVVEPERPAADSKQERALVHIHGPDGVVCSGVVVGPRLVATAQQCVKAEGHGPVRLDAARELRVEVAASSLTWTNRSAALVARPACGPSELDVAILVLDRPAPVEPLRVVAAPNTGAVVQALGFGHCAGEQRPLRDRVGTVRSRVSDVVVIDVPLCKGDAGGPVVDGRGGDVIGLVSRRDDPEGSPLRTTTIARLDTAQARALIAQAQELEGGADPAKLEPVACR